MEKKDNQGKLGIIIIVTVVLIIGFIVFSNLKGKTNIYYLDEDYSITYEQVSSSSRDYG